MVYERLKKKLLNSLTSVEGGRIGKKKRNEESTRCECIELEKDDGKDERSWEYETVVLVYRSAGRRCLLCLHLANQSN